MRFNCGDADDAFRGKLSAEVDRIQRGTPRYFSLHVPYRQN